jgi:elongation factor 1-alpha
MSLFQAESEGEGTKKEHLGIVIVGHVDAGKSTTTGHLLFKLGGMTERELEKLRQEASAQGKDSFSYAFFMDKQKEERERGVTIACTTKEFFTKNYHYTIIDAPGHRDFVKNMISGASQADVALLMVPANKGGFETSIQKGDHKTGAVAGQTRQHANLCKLIGVEQIIVAVNKMDDPSVNYSEERFNEIRGEVEKMIQKAGYKPKKVPFIPMSGFRGENLTEVSENMPWYKGFEVNINPKTKVKGHTLVDALNTVVQVPKRETDKALRVPVSGMFKIPGIGDVITGRVEQGTLKPGMVVRFIPSGSSGKVFSIEMHHKTVESASPGDNVGINVKAIPKDKRPMGGDVMVVENDPLEKGEQPGEVEEFTATVAVQDHPGQLQAATADGKGGFTPGVHIRTSKAPCQMYRINWKMGKKTGGIKDENPKFVEQGDQAEIVFRPKMPMFVQTFEECPGLGRIAVMDSNTLRMLGKITSVTYKK